MSKQLDDTSKWVKTIYQRLQVTKWMMTKYLKMPRGNTRRKKSCANLHMSIKRLDKLQPPFHESISKTLNLCAETAEDRKNHIFVIEASRNKRIFDNFNEYQTYAITHHGQEEYDEFIRGIRCKVFGETNLPS
jgi:hypothetical protein